MSVVELSSRDGSGHDDGGSYQGPDRTPPQDIAAEQSVIGAMLLSKDAIADVVETLREQRLLPPGAPDHLRRRSSTSTAAASRPTPSRCPPSSPASSEIARVGGAPYLHTLVASVPTAANAGYYARIVQERAVLRRLVEAGTRIVQMGYAGDGDVDQLVDRAQAAVYDVTDKRTSEDYLVAQGHHGRHARGDRRDRQPRRRPRGRAHRLRRPRLAHQRPARRPDDRRRRASRDRQVHARPRPRAVGVDQARPHQRHLQPGDEPQRDRDAPAVGRGVRSRCTTCAAAR